MACMVSAATVMYLFLWGALFPFSPVILGFTRYELPHTVVYVQNGAAFDGYAAIDSLIPGVEAFHELSFRKKPELFVFRDRTRIMHKKNREDREPVKPWV